MKIMGFNCLKAAFAASSGVAASSPMAGGGSDPMLLTLMAPTARCPKVAHPTATATMEMAQ